MSALHPYGKAIAGAVSAAIGAFLAAYTDLPPWVGVALTLLGTLVSVYFAANVPADPEPGRDPVVAVDPYVLPATGSGTATATWGEQTRTFGTVN